MPCPPAVPAAPGGGACCAVQVDEDDAQAFTFAIPGGRGKANVQTRAIMIGPDGKRFEWNGNGGELPPEAREALQKAMADFRGDFEVEVDVVGEGDGDEGDDQP